MPTENELIQILNNELAIELPGKISFEELKEYLSEHINHLIQTDFNKLVSLLYRIDINESRLKALLRENKDADTGKIITDLIIERQLQKIKSRKQNKGDNRIPDDEKW